MSFSCVARLLYPHLRSDNRCYRYDYDDSVVVDVVVDVDVWIVAANLCVRYSYELMIGYFDGLSVSLQHVSKHSILTSLFTLQKKAIEYRSGIITSMVLTFSSSSSCGYRRCHVHQILFV